MSWIFHEPLEPAVYARRALSRPLPARGFSRSRSFHSLDLWTEEPVQSTRRAFAPPSVVLRGFSRARSFSALDLWSDEVQPPQRRAYAPLRVISAATVPFSPVRRLQASLLASDAYDEFYPTQRPTRFVVGHAQPGTDIGLSASFTFSASGATADATLSFTGAGDDPTVPIGMQALPLEGLGAGPLEIVADKPATTYGGQSASKIV